jgi:hypothetical protein
MKTFVAIVGSLLVVLLSSNLSPNAFAQGCYYGGGNYLGSADRYYNNYRSYYGGLNGGYRNSGYSNNGYGVYPGYGVVPWSTNYGGGWGGGHAHWHDTTHLDYHPGEYVRHRNHYHYIPGHYDVHEEGHWDYHD